jgi:4-amino-4-deoxy-L-arabinose transferase-like glycosyltransferase
MTFFPSLQHRNQAIVIGLAALTFRILFAFTYSEVDYYGAISDGHLEVAQNILAGRGAVVAVDTSRTWEPPTYAVVPMIDRPLGYPSLICVPLSFNRSALSVKLFQSVLGAISCLLLFSLGGRLFNQRTGLIAAWCYALWPISARLETVILADAVMSFFLLCAMFFFHHADQIAKSARRLFFAGLVLGCGTLMRPDISLLSLLLALGLIVTQGLKPMWKQSAVLVAGFGLIIGLHTTRNYQATNGRVIPIGIGNGTSLWEGISQFGDTLGTVYGDGRMAEREGYRSWSYPNGINRDRARFRQAMELILNHPGFYSTMIAKRVGVLLRPDGIVMGKFIPPPKTFFADHPGATWSDFAATNRAAFASQLALILLQWLFLALAIVAIFRQKNLRRYWAVPAIIIYYVAMHVITNTEPRYFYPAMPFVFLLASTAIDSIIKRRTHATPLTAKQS